MWSISKRLYQALLVNRVALVHAPAGREPAEPAAADSGVRGRAGDNDGSIESEHRIDRETRERRKPDQT